jgi:hypothetical protein
MANIQTKKYTIIELLTELEDERFVDLILKLMLKHEGSPTMPPLSQKEIEGIQLALDEAEQGKDMSLEEARQKLAKWLK